MSANDPTTVHDVPAIPLDGSTGIDARSPAGRRKISRERLHQTRSAVARSGKRYHETGRMLPQPPPHAGRSSPPRAARGPIRPVQSGSAPQNPPALGAPEPIATIDGAR